MSSPPTPDELLPALHEIKWIPGQHYAIQLDEHYKRLHAAYLALVAERDRLRAGIKRAVDGAFKHDYVGAEVVYASDLEQLLEDS